MLDSLLSLIFLLSPILLIILTIFLVFFLRKKRNWPVWFKVGLIFFIISLISAILTMWCVDWSEGIHPDAGMGCIFPGLPFMYLLIFENLEGYTLFIIGIIINTIIGGIIGALFGAFKRQENGE